MRYGATISLGAAFLLALAAAAGSQDKKGGDAQGQPGGPDMQKMMEVYMRLAAPGPNHDFLKPLAGNWTVAGKFRMTPDMPWTENKSEGKVEWVLGGRFLQQHYKGEPMLDSPVPFEGIGFLGFDNQKKKFVSSWMDNMGTMIMSGEGIPEAGGKSISFRSEFVDPMTGKPSYMKSIYKIESEDKFGLQLSGPGPDGKEFVVAEMVHTRKK